MVVLSIFKVNTSLDKEIKIESNLQGLSERTRRLLKQADLSKLAESQRRLTKSDDSLALTRIADRSVVIRIMANQPMLDNNLERKKHC